MKIKVGSARINEFGEISGGKSGDQTGKECAIEDCYIHDLGWVIIRAKDPVAKKLIAQDMIYLCENDYIGYDQPNDESLLRVVEKYNYDCSKVKEYCDTDCARAVRVCVLYAGIDCPSFYTATEIEVLRATGKFNIITDKDYCSNMDNYMVGDILCTPVKGHTCVVVSKETVENAYQFYSANRDVCFYTTNGNTNIREFPTTDSNVVGVIPNNAKVLCDGITCMEWNNNKLWHYIRYYDKHGFVSEKMLTNRKEF